MSICLYISARPYGWPGTGNGFVDDDDDDDDDEGCGMFNCSMWWECLDISCVIPK